MAIDPGPHDLDHVRPILAPDGKAILKGTSPIFHQELDDEYQAIQAQQVIKKIDCETARTTCEIHPEAD